MYVRLCAARRTRGVAWLPRGIKMLEFGCKFLKKVEVESFSDRVGRSQEKYLI